MGVPVFFRWLTKHYEESIISSECPFEEVHQLYLDFNGGVHPAARSKPENSPEEMIETIIQYLKYILSVAPPTELLYIAFDGVAPRGKMNQQRLRRFKAIKETSEINQLKTEYGISIDEKKQKDFNMISPATIFMELLSDKIKIFLAEFKSGKHQHLKIIFSDTSIPGEGEHKILQYLKLQPKDKNCLVYGLDSDLIFLFLGTNRSNVALIRENTLLKNNDLNLDLNKFPEMSYFLINELRNHIVNIMNPYTSLTELENIKIFSSKDAINNTTDLSDLYDKMKMKDFFTAEKDTYNLIRDYIFISFLLGNDFIPSVSALKIRDGGIEQILRAYKIVIQKRCQYLLNSALEINVEFFLDFIQILANDEVNSLKKQKRTRDRRIKFQFTNQRAPTYEIALEQHKTVEGKHPDIINIFREGWEHRYYYYYFHIKNNDSPYRQIQINDICNDYIKALHWIAKYYFTGCPDWHWYYQYDATPLLCDLIKYVNNKKTDINMVHFIENGPVEPYHQLLIILPPQSAHLLPKPYLKLMTSEISPIIHYYPTNFELDYYGKRFLWECHPKLPMINPSELTKHLTHIKDQLTPLEVIRNQIGVPFEI